MKREVNFELLRVLAMFFIVTWHFIVHGIMHVLTSAAPPICQINSFHSIFNWIIVEYIACLTAVGVNCYVLISGYFLVKSNFKLNKVVKIWSQTFFYSAGIYVILICAGVISFDIKKLAESILVIRANSYWFVTQYIALLVLSPFLSKLALSLTKQRFQLLLLILFFINVSLSFGFPYGDIYSSPANISWFVFLFYIAAYIRLFNPSTQRKVNYGKLYFLFCLILLICYILHKYILYHWKGLDISYQNSLPYNGYTFFSSLLLFLWAKNYSFKSNILYRFIIRLAPYTFGVYLIHDNSYIRTLLWERWFIPSRNIDSWYLIPKMLLSVILIYLICTILDFLRTKLFLLFKLNEKIEQINYKKIFGFTIEKFKLNKSNTEKF